MTVYVDKLQQRKAHSMRAIRAGIPHNHFWCHLMADTEAELRGFAVLLGLKASWQHGDHFDLTPPRRKHAVELGAKEVSSRELVELRRANRAMSMVQVPSAS